MPFPMGTRMKPRGGLVFRLSSIVIAVAGNKGTFVPISTVDDRNWWARRFCFYMAIESASMFLKLSLRIAVSFVVMDYGNRPRGSVESSVKPC